LEILDLCGAFEYWLALAIMVHVFFVGFLEIDRRDKRLNVIGVI
jgi:hypothetical protein